MKVGDHMEMLTGNPRYAELCQIVDNKAREMYTAMEQLEKEFPLENDGYYCIFGVDATNLSVRPTHSS